MIKAKQEEISRHLHALVGERNPDSSSDPLQLALSYIAEEMNAYGLEVVYDAFGTSETGLDPSSYPNLIGHLNLSSETHIVPRKEVLVLGAHYDTVSGSPGADDNASGLAVLLETARLLSGMQGNLDVQFIAFSLEEAGFIGSKAFVKTAEANNVKIHGAIILECVGFTDSRPGSQRRPPGLPIELPAQGDFIGLIANEGAQAIKTSFETAIANTLPYVGLVVPGKGEVLPDSRRSDHVPFWDRDIPAVVLTDTANFRNPNYHRSGDRLETLDLNFMTTLSQVLAETVIDLAELKS